MPFFSALQHFSISQNFLTALLFSFWSPSDVRNPLQNFAFLSLKNLFRPKYVHPRFQDPYFRVGGHFITTGIAIIFTFLTFEIAVCCIQGWTGSKFRARANSSRKGPENYGYLQSCLLKQTKRGSRESEIHNS